MFNIFIAERIFTFYKPERSKKVLTITYEKPFSNSTFAKKKKKPEFHATITRRRMFRSPLIYYAIKPPNGKLLKK